MLTVEEYAQKAGISGRAVRAKAQKGLIQARKMGNQWLIQEDPSFSEFILAGRPISAHAFNQLALMADGYQQNMSPQARHRTRQRLERLKREGVSQLQNYRRRAGMTIRYFSLNPQELATLYQEMGSSLTGVSHPDSGLGASLVDAYVETEELLDLELFYTFKPALKESHNVRLRLGEKPRIITRLHVATDLQDDLNPRALKASKVLFEKIVREVCSE